jgi:hypothetical protein
VVKLSPLRLTFSGNYATGGEAIAASSVGGGLKKIEHVFIQGGVAMASGVATGVAIGWDQANLKFVFYEGSAAGTALSEKTNAEAYPTGCFIDVTFVGN